MQNCFNLILVELVSLITTQLSSQCNNKKFYIIFERLILCKRSFIIKMNRK